jgi:hypothetical protein
MWADAQAQAQARVAAASAEYGNVEAYGMQRGGVSPGQAGSFQSLDAAGTVGDNLTPHHMPQAALNFTSRGEGGAIVLPQAEHVLTRTYGFRGAQLAQQEANLSFRNVLARDIRDLRAIAGSKYNGGNQELLDYYRQNFPQLLEKPATSNP